MPTNEQGAPLRVEPVYVKAKLPADVWRVLSTAAVPDPWGTLRPVVINDTGTSAVVLSAGHYDTLIAHLRELESDARDRGQP